MSKQSSAEKLVIVILRITLQVFLNVIFYVLVIFVVVKGSKFAYTMAYETFGSVTATPKPGFERTITVTDGEGTMDLSKELEEDGIIVNRYTFYLRAKLMKQNIKPGTYKVNSSMNYDEIYSVITGENTEK